MGLRDIFRKLSGNEGDVVDLGELQERGIIKIRAVEDDNVGGVVDLSSSGSGSESSSESEGVVDFFGAIASSSETESSGSSSDSYGSSDSGSDNLVLINKIDNISERLSRLIDRVELLERKMARFERGRL